MAAPDTLSPDLEYEPVHEIRMAVVMYGGVSLAVYINGITQELLRLVRATAPEVGDGGVRGRLRIPTDALSPTEHVYRRLGQLGIGNSDQALAPSAPVQTRFVVDILSGTSAGGLNAIFLAKALANGQDLGGLKQLWMTQADIATLLNDGRSVRDHPNLVAQTPPRSLLNSERMYLLLYEALLSMDTHAAGDRHADGSVHDCARPGPLVDELDLYVTATDIRGLPVTLRLDDHVVEEYQHRHVFHLAAGERRMIGLARNDFSREENPFLAFIGRCTSAFPFAFEPMSFGDLPRLLGWSSAETRLQEKRWKRFFRGRLSAGGQAHDVPFMTRAYSDGGILDNRPFSYATDTLERRQSDLIAHRKLLYLEPVPRHHRQQAAEKPDALETVLAAAASIPSYEPIREDLQRILERNRQLGELRELTDQVMVDILNDGQRSRLDPKGLLSQKMNGDRFAQQTLSGLIQTHGTAYATYHRTKIRALIRDLAVMIARCAGFEEGSGQQEAIGIIIETWVTERYSEEGGRDLAKFTKFLMDFDMGYRLRRLNFVRRQVRDLVLRRAPALQAYRQIADGPKPNEFSAEFLRSWRRLSGSLRESYVHMRSVGRILRARRLEGMPLLDPEAEDLALAVAMRGLILDLLGRMRITSRDLDPILKAADPPAAPIWQGGGSGANEAQGTARRRMARELIDSKERRLYLAAIEVTLAWFLRGEFKTLSSRCTAFLSPQPDASATERALLQYARFFYDNFEWFDYSIYPIKYATDFMDAESVDVVRISPEDARTVFDERIAGQKKLAGDRLANFAAFLRRTWRENDMMWGRLDAAERIIDMVLPRGHPECPTLKRQALCAILEEELPEERCHDLWRNLASELAREGANATTQDDVVAHVRRMAEHLTSDRSRAVVARLLSGTDEAFLDVVRREYRIDRGAEPGPTLDVASRATQISGRLFDGIAERIGRDGRPFAWLTRLGTIAWGVVQISLPMSFGSILFRHWLHLLFATALVVIVAGALLARPELRAVGQQGIIALGAIGILVATLSNVMAGWRRWKLAGWVTYACTMGGFLVMMYFTWPEPSSRLPFITPGGAGDRFLIVGIGATLVLGSAVRPVLGERATLPSHLGRWFSYSLAFVGVAIWWGHHLMRPTMEQWIAWIGSARAPAFWIALAVVLMMVRFLGEPLWLLLHSGYRRLLVALKSGLSRSME